MECILFLIILIFFLFVYFNFLDCKENNKNFLYLKKRIKKLENQKNYLFNYIDDIYEELERFDCSEKNEKCK